LEQQPIPGKIRNLHFGEQNILRLSLIGPVHPYRGGISHYTTALSNAILSNHILQVISFKRQYPKWLYPGESDKVTFREPSRPITAEYILDSIDPLTWIHTANRIKSFMPDAVLFQWWVSFWAPAFTSLAIFLRRYPKVFLIHNVYPHEKKIFDELLTKMVLSHGDFFVTHTQREQEKLINIFPQAHVDICPFPIYGNFPISGISQEVARNRLGFPKDIHLLVLFFGFVRPYKGLSVLLDALAYLCDQGKDVHLAVVGEIWESKSIYLEKIKKLGLEHRVIIVNRYIPDEEVELYFSAGDVMVAPYTSGTQSASLAAALGFGIPVVATDIAAAGIPVEYQPKVQIVAPNDPHALAEAILSSAKKSTPGKRDVPEDTEGWHNLVRTIEKGVAERHTKIAKL